MSDRWSIRKVSDDEYHLMENGAEPGLPLLFCGEGDGLGLSVLTDGDEAHAVADRFRSFIHDSEPEALAWVLANLPTGPPTPLHSRDCGMNSTGNSKNSDSRSRCPHDSQARRPHPGVPEFDSREHGGKRGTVEREDGSGDGV